MTAPGDGWRRAAEEHREVARLFADMPDVALDSCAKALWCDLHAVRIDRTAESWARVERTEVEGRGHEVRG